MAVSLWVHRQLCWSMLVLLGLWVNLAGSLTYVGPWLEQLGCLWSPSSLIYPASPGRAGAPGVSCRGTALLLPHSGGQRRSQES